MDRTPLPVNGSTRRGLLRAGLVAGAASAVPAAPRGGSAQGAAIRIGVLSDMSGPFADNAGPGSVVAARLAAEDFARTHPDVRVEIVSADMQNRPDIGSAQARGWYDRDGVDAILDVPASAVALAVADLTRQRDKVALFSGAAISDLTGSACSPNHVQWTYDTWSLARATCAALAAEDKNTWFFLVADNALGHSLQRDASEAVAATGGRVLGAVRYAFPGTTDFSSYLLQARTSGARVLGLANAGADTVNAIKGAAEFGLMRGGRLSVAALLFNIADVHAIGASAASGLYLANAFYWDMDDGTRDFARRFAPQAGGRYPSQLHAGAYASTLHYLKAVAALGVPAAKASGATAVARMKAIPTEDPLFGRGTIRPDGRKVHDMHLFQVEAPSAAGRGWAYLRPRRAVPGAEAFRPMEARCAS